MPLRLALILICTLSLVGVVSAGKIEPSTLDISLNPGGSFKELKSVTTDQIRGLDVLFVIDVSGSMGDELSKVKDSIEDIIDGISSEFQDSVFGVATFIDYPRYYSCCGYNRQYGLSYDYAWRLEVDITKDKSAVSSKVKSLRTGSGFDIPEDYARALYESQFVGWRGYAKKIVVLFGDAHPRLRLLHKVWRENWIQGGMG